MSLAQATGVFISAAGGANGILVLVALILFAVAAFLAGTLTSTARPWWAILVSAGLAVAMLALLVGS